MLVVEEDFWVWIMHQYDSANLQPISIGAASLDIVSEIKCIQLDIITLVCAIIHVGVNMQVFKTETCTRYSNLMPIAEHEVAKPHEEVQLPLICSLCQC